VCLIQSPKLLEHVRHASPAHELKENVQPISRVLSPNVLSNMGVGREPTEQVDLPLQCPRVGGLLIDRDLLDSEQHISNILATH